MAKAIMIQGTASHVGKSLLCTALCRILAADGYRVAPFKSWNMALNSYVTLDGGEIGRAQGEQAEAAGIEATVDMNPILVKPKGKGQSQVIIRGRACGDVGLETRTGADYISFCLEVINRSYQALSREYDVIVIEGAGSPAEINLVEQDVANMKVARLANAPVLLVADLNRGGALAAVVGTMLLLPAEDRARVAGYVFNKFRGDRSLLVPGLSVVEERTGRPVLGVIPYLHDVRLAEEDGVALERRPEEVKEGAGKLLLKVVRLPYISNFTDVDALASEEDTTVEYVNRAGGLAGADAIIVPGSKNSVSDLYFLRESGLADEIVTLARQGTPVAGICGGYQLLGKTLADPDGHESGGMQGRMPGLGLLEAETTFFDVKTVARAEARSLLPFAAGEEVRGYEIHMGQTVRTAGCRPAFALKGKSGTAAEEGTVSACGLIWGTYLHGVFDAPAFRRAWLDSLRQRRGWDRAEAAGGYDKQEAYDILAGRVRAALDLEAIRSIMGLHGQGGV